MYQLSFLGTLLRFRTNRDTLVLNNAISNVNCSVQLERRRSMVTILSKLKMSYFKKKISTPSSERISFRENRVAPRSVPRRQLQ